MTKIAAVAAYLVKKLWLTMAVLLVLFAVLLSVLRYALPHLEDKKYLLEDYVNQQYGVNLSIGSVHAQWQPSGPSIVLKQVSLAKDDNSPVSLDIQTIYVDVDFWQSLSQRLISSNRFELVGLNLDIDADRIEGAGDSDFPVVDALKSLFLEQLQQFSLNNGVVSLSRADRTQVFDVEELSWLNDGEKHQGQGAIQVRDFSANSASFAVDLSGQKDALTGTFYARAEDLDLSPYVSDLLQIKRPLTQSRANFEVWTQIENSRMAAVQVEFDRSLLEWGGNDYAPLYTGLRGGSIQALPSEGGWNLRVDQLILDSSNQTLVTDLVGQVTPQGEWILSTVKPVSINPFLMLTPLFLDDANEEELQALDPRGQLATLQMKWNGGRSPSGGLSATAKLLDVGWNQTDVVPGMTALDVDLFWHKNQGAVLLEASDTSLDADKSLPQDQRIDVLKAALYVYSRRAGEATHWEVLLRDTEVSTDLVTLTPSFRYNITTGELAIYAGISDVPLREVSALFPAVMGEGTRAYLTRAFGGAGTLKNGRVLWYGKPAAFPFRQKDGIFQAYASLDNADFVFAENWPGLKALDLDLYFVNDSLVMEAPGAKLADVTISDMSAAIPGLSGSSILTIYAKGDGTGEQLAALMAQSSIKDSLGNVLNNEVMISGPVSSQIKLHIPLNGDEVVASGNALLAGNRIYIRATDMTLENAQGAIQFENDKIHSDQLGVRWLSQPMQISLEGHHEDQAYLVDVGLDGNWDSQTLLSYVSPGFTSKVSGTTDWMASVALTLGEDAYQYTATVNADLTDVASALPRPFGKEAATASLLQVTSKGDNTASSISASLGDEVKFDGLLPHAEMTFSRAHLALGKTDFSGLGMGFSISAGLDQMDVGRWYDTLDILVSEQAGKAEGEHHLFSVPERIFVNTDRLTLGDQQLENVAITAKQSNNNWQLDINAEQARAVVNIYDEWLSRGIDIDADFMRLEASKDFASSSAISSDWKPDNLPPVYFHCDQCSVNDIELGEVVLEMARNDKGMEIRQAKATNKYGSLSASGLWVYGDSLNQTQLSGSVKSRDVGAMLEQYGFSSGIKDSEADIAFSLTWPKSPMDFALAGLNGTIDWGLTDGYLTELSDKGSRIFTLFSLNSMVRKLSLDFRDVFAKGFFYDKMDGTLAIQDGVAYTDDTEIDGGAGEIEIKGFTDLTAGTLNYDVSFTPNVTGNLPILVYFLATPPTALAALALDQVLTSAKVISNVNYKVTGTLSEPVFREVGRDSKDISLPARNTPASTEDETDRPLSKDDLKRLKMEVIDG
ncbi:YhdP family protein [Alteromonas sp. CYL-A6]|uniref:YhdP family protein n=1 Tax=Alteromonas nitratireducens TaxID=3390813 RepID=UPI0034AFB7E8